MNDIFEKFGQIPIICDNMIFDFLIVRFFASNFLKINFWVHNFLSEDIIRKLFHKFY